MGRRNGRLTKAELHVTSLKRFIIDNNLPFGIVINNSEKVMMLTENIIQIPAGLV